MKEVDYDEKIEKEEMAYERRRRRAVRESAVIPRRTNVTRAVVNLHQLDVTRFITDTFHRK